MTFLQLTFKAKLCKFDNGEGGLIWKLLDVESK